MVSTGKIILLACKGAVPAGTPLLFATLGALLSERSGVYNVALEGIMLVGALAGIMGTLVTGDPVAGVVFGGGAGLLLTVPLAFLTVTFGANQIVCGFALVILGTGLSSYFGIPYVGKQIEAVQCLPISWLRDIPWLGDIFFQQDLFVYLSYALVVMVFVVLYFTRWGIAIRACGEDPYGAQLMGVDVIRTRYLCVLLSGFLAGLGGAYLSVVHTGMWVGQMTAGRGWIAVALVIFSGWHPLKALGGAYLFGVMISLQLRLQATGVSVSVHLMSMLPYAMTIFVLLLAASKIKRQSMPASLGKVFSRN